MHEGDLTGRRPGEDEPTGKERRFGSDIELTVTLRRHETPGKDPNTGMSADFLTDEGRQRAAKRGPELSGDVKGYASPKKRAHETVGLALENAAADARVINARIEDIQKQDVRAAQGKDGNVFNIRTRQELDTVQNLAPVFKKATVWANEEIAQGRATKEQILDLQVQYYLDHPDEATALGTETPHETAQDIGYNLHHAVEMSERFNNGSRVGFEEITHGPKLEPFLKEVLIREIDGKRVKGFENVSEIGGAFQPGEGIELAITRDENGEASLRLKFRGNEYDIDNEALETLAQEYVERQIAEKTSVETAK